MDRHPPDSPFEPDQRPWSLWQLALVAGVFLTLYLAFLSIDYDPNGIIEAINLESGSGVSPNHILYTALGRALWGIARALGYSGKAIHLLQTFNAFCGAIAVACACAAFTELGAPRRAALAAAGLWGTSFIFWYYSTDVAYVTLAALFVTAALWCSAVLARKRSDNLAILMGLLVALGVLTFQMVCFLLPVLLWPLRRRGGEALRSVAAAGALIGAFYLSIGINTGHTSVTELLKWASDYAGGQLPEWGRFEAGRISTASFSAVRSFQWDFFERGRDFLEHPLQKHVWRISAGAVSFTVFLVVTLALAIRNGFERSRGFWWMLVGYLVCWPFIVWFSPSESFWFLIPNLFLCGVIAMVWGRRMRSLIPSVFVFGGLALMAASIFQSWVWPKHRDPGSVGRLADCIAENVGPEDTVIATDWTWPARLEYFHGIRAFQIIDVATTLARDRDRLFEYIAGEEDKTRQRHGRVFIMEPSSYPPQHLAWLEEQTAFSAADFDRFPGSPAFQCEDSKFREVKKP